ncbi:MAG TPA: hypothetical protein VGJ05_00070 [Fimbriiglobus sp.]|jgi:hypothetical protein
MRAFEIHAPKKLPISPFATPPAAPQEIRWRRWLVVMLLPLVGLIRTKPANEKPATPDAHESFETWQRQVEASQRPAISYERDIWTE